jgi:hypothetical protein
MLEISLGESHAFGNFGDTFTGQFAFFVFDIH